MSIHLSRTLPQSVFGDCDINQVLRSKDTFSYLGNCSNSKSDLEKYKKAIGVKGSEDIIEMYKRDDPRIKSDPRFKPSSPFSKSPW